MSTGQRGVGFGKQPTNHQFEASNASTPPGMLGASGTWLGPTLNITLVVWRTPGLQLFPASDKGSAAWDLESFMVWELLVPWDSLQVEEESRHGVPN